MNSSKNVMVWVVVTSYRQPQFIKETLSSIFAQELPKNIQIKLYIIDDFSDDKGETKNAIDDVCEGNSNEWIYISKHYLNDNVWVSRARNYWIYLADDCDYIAFCDWDDSREPRALIEKITVLEETKSDFVWNNITKIDHAWCSIDKEEYPRVLSEMLRKFLVQSTFQTSSLVVRTEFIRKHNILFDQKFEPAEDHAFKLRMLKMWWGCVNVDKFLTKYRLHEKSVSATKSLKQRLNLLKINYTYGRSMPWYTYAQCVLVIKILCFWAFDSSQQKKIIQVYQSIKNKF